ncbi:MAG: alpha/beta fold hydrolase [Donghicola eburneus]|nr:alpha/beta fold hydrolase [Donghicola eburneus]MCI5043038.1 alpha/beta fold hydrolase [Donghicola eburneus]
MDTDRYVEVMGMRTRYRQIGTSGSDVLLVHGIYSSIEDWDANVDALAQNHRVWVLDLPGCGHTDKPADFDQTLASQVDFLVAYVQTVGLVRFHLVGHSMGGRLSLELTRALPDRVISLSLVSPAVIGFETYFVFRLATIPLLGELLTWPNRFGLSFLMKQVVYDPSLITDAIVDQRLALAKLPGAQSAFLRTLRKLANVKGFRVPLVKDLHSWLPEINLPLMLIWGQQDKLAPVHHAKFIEDKTAVRETHLYERCGHLPQLEHKDRFNADLGAFLTDVDRE